MKDRTITTEALAVLSLCEVSGQTAFIRSGQLDRKLYEEVNAVLAGIGGKWNRKAKGHVFEEPTDEIIEMLEGCMATGLAVPLHRNGFFPTPTETADKLIEMAEMQYGQGPYSILEPSAGDGNLVHAVMAKLHRNDIRSLDAVENDQKNYVKLCVKFTDQPWFFPYHIDFLLWQPRKQYDRIVMNPPFYRLSEIDHIMRAWELLAPSGILVSVAGAGVTFRREAKAVQFREFVEENGSMEPLPENSFKFSGTGVNTVVIKLSK